MILPAVEYCSAKPTLDQDCTLTPSGSSTSSHQHKDLTPTFSHPFPAISTTQLHGKLGQLMDLN